MAWIYLLVAGVLEIVWAYSMKQSQGFTRWVPSLVTLTTMLVSFWLLAVAMRTIPLGTAYTIWTGIGAVVDAEGQLWLALWGAGRVVRLDHDGRIVAEIILPVSQPSCPAFAGERLERLYITSAREGLSEAELAGQPLAGGLFVAEVGVAGLAERASRTR